MASKWALERAAQAWCTPKTEKKDMDLDLAEAFADILQDEVTRPRPNMCTTDQLYAEIGERLRLLQADK